MRKAAIDTVFEKVGFQQKTELIDSVKKEIGTVLGHIPIGELGYAVDHFIDHIVACVPEVHLKSARNEDEKMSCVQAYFKNCTNGSDTVILATKAAKNMQLQRQRIKTMLNELGINKEDGSLNRWKKHIQRVTLAVGAINPSNLEATFSQITELAKGRKGQHPSNKEWIKSAIHDWKQSLTS